MSVELLIPIGYREKGGGVVLCLPAGDGAGGLVLARQVKEVGRVAGGIALGGDASGVADGEVVVGDGELLLDVEGGLDKGGEKAGGDVPFDVAVEEPDTLEAKTPLLGKHVHKNRGGGRMEKDVTRVVGLEAHDNVAVGPDDEGVSSHGNGLVVALGEGLVFKSTGFFLRAVDGLEGVAVEMERVATGVEVVDDNLHNLALLEDKWMGVLAVDGGVVCEVAGGEGGVQGGDLGMGVGDVVEEGVVLAVLEVVHDDVELDDLVWLGEQLHLVVGHKVHVVKGGELVNEGGLGEGGLGVVRQPAGDVVVEVLWQSVKESL